MELSNCRGAAGPDVNGEEEPFRVWHDKVGELIDDMVNREMLHNNWFSNHCK